MSKEEEKELEQLCDLTGGSLRHEDAELVRNHFVAKWRKFIADLLRQANSQRPNVLNADAIERLAKEYGL